jgi:hypothetical protein
MSLSLATPYIAEFASYKIEKGKMNIYFPISGSLEDPYFEIGKHFLGASPVSTLGDLFGSD